jgi:hypothetical protein
MKLLDTVKMIDETLAELEIENQFTYSPAL